MSRQAKLLPGKKGNELIGRNQNRPHIMIIVVKISEKQNGIILKYIKMKKGKGPKYTKKSLLRHGKGRC